MALSLQQEQQVSEMGWELPEGISDLELAKKLQEEEDRRASEFYQEQEEEQEQAAVAAQAQVQQVVIKVKNRCRSFWHKDGLYVNRFSSGCMFEVVAPMMP